MSTTMAVSLPWVPAEISLPSQVAGVVTRFTIIRWAYMLTLRERSAHRTSWHSRLHRPSGLRRFSSTPLRALANLDVSSAWRGDVVFEFIPQIGQIQVWKQP